MNNFKIVKKILKLVSFDKICKNDFFNKIKIIILKNTIFIMNNGTSILTKSKLMLFYFKNIILPSKYITKPI